MVPEVFVEVVEAYKEKYSVITICECLGIPKSTYYRWKKKSSLELPALHQLIIKICKEHFYRLGHRNVRGILKNDHSIKVNRKTVQKIMQKYHLQCQIKEKRKAYIAGESKFIVPNLLSQNFKAERPNQKWVTDITYLP